MTRALGKNILRSITGSFGRYVAILLITLIGVSFLTGLRLARPVMLATQNEYLQNTQFFDLRLISTIGFDAESVADIAAADGVEVAAGGITADFIWLRDGEETVWHAMSLTDGVNEPELTAGRMPEAANECLVDSQAFTEDILGQTMDISDCNSEETLENFAFGEYTVVGLARTPLYMDFSRGTSSLGNGSITGFVLIPEDGFSAEYYTEVYLRHTGTWTPYSDEYNSMIDDFSEEMELVAGAAADARMDRILSDAEREITDAELELEDGRAEGQAELDDARTELEDARVQLEDAAAELADAERELRDAEREIADGATELDDADAELRDAELELEDADAQLADARSELESAEAELTAGQLQLDEAAVQLLDAEAELTAGEAQLADAAAQLAVAEAQLEAGDEELADARAQLDEAAALLDAGADALISGWSTWEEALSTGRSELAANQTILEEGRAQLDALEETYQSGISALEEDAEDYQAALAEWQVLNEQYEALLAAGMDPESEELQKLKEQCDALKAVIDAYESSRAQLEVLRTALDEGWAELASGEVALTVASASLDEFASGLTAYRVGAEEYEIGARAMADGWAEYYAGWAAYEENAQLVAAGRAEYEAGAAAYAENARVVADGWAAYYEGLREYEDGARAASEGWEAYYEGLAEYQDGLAEYEAGVAEYQDGLQAYEDGLAEYRDGLIAYEDGLAEYEDGAAEFEAEIAEAEAEIADARAELDAMESPDLYVLTRSTNSGYVSMESDSQIVQNLSTVFPVFFFLVAALICSTTMTRMVDDDRTQIGVLRALGYSRGSILFKYILYAGSAATIGCLIGYFLGGFLFPLAIWTAYQMLYNIDGFVQVYHPILLMVSLAASLLCSVGVTWLSCRRTMMKSAPADLIRPATPAAGKRIFLERITPFWSHLSFLLKVTLRNIFRFKRRMFMMILGIAGCTALVLTGFGIRDSVANIGNFQFDDIMRYDISVTATDPITEETKAAMTEICREDLDAAASAMMFSGELSGSTATKTVSFVASDDAEFTEIFDLNLDGDSVALPDTGEILLSENLASQAGVKVGDTVILTSVDDVRQSAVVAGFVENYVESYVYMTGATYEQVFGIPYEPETLFVRVVDGADEYAAAAALSNLDGVAAVSVVTDTREMIDGMMSSLNYVVLLVLASAAALAFVVMFNLGNINISERQREIATIKVLGFHARETGAYVFRENFILSLMGIVVGIPVGILLHRFVMSQIKIDMVTFKVVLKPLSYLLTIALVVLFIFVVDRILRRKIRRVDMAESLKSVE